MRREPLHPGAQRSLFHSMEFRYWGFYTNQAWMMTVTLAADLLRWFQLLSLTSPLTTARPKRLRWTLLQAPDTPTNPDLTATAPASQPTRT